MVWLINGLVCKLLDLVPRHREIVARILGGEHSLALTRAIGLSEVLMALWIFSGIFGRVNAVTQIVIVLTMNIIEQFLAPDLLLFGRLNGAFALLFVLLIYYREFHMTENAGLS